MEEEKRERNDRGVRNGREEDGNRKREKRRQNQGIWEGEGGGEQKGDRKEEKRRWLEKGGEENRKVSEGQLRPAGALYTDINENRSKMCTHFIDVLHLYHLVSFIATLVEDLLPREEVQAPVNVAHLNTAATREEQKRSEASKLCPIPT